LELLDQPAITIPKTPSEDDDRIKNIPTFTSTKTEVSLKGITAHAKTANKKVLIGANIKIIELAGLGTIVSFDNNLIASANACKEPKRPTTLGPLLR